MIYKELTKKLTMAGLADLLIRFKAFIFIPIISKLLGVSYYGLWTQLMVTISMAYPVVMLGMGFGFLRFLPGESSEKIKKEFMPLIYYVAAASVTGALIIIFLSGFLSKVFFGGKEASFFMKIGSLYLMTVPMHDLLIMYFRAREKIAFYLVLIILDIALSITLVLIFAKYGLNFILASLILSNILLIIISLINLRKKINFKLLHFNKLRKYFVYSLPFIPITWLLWVNNSSDRYFLGYFRTIKEVGIYSAVYAISYFVLNMVISPLYIVFQPILTRLWNTSNQKSALYFLNEVIRYALFLMFPISIGFFILSKTIIVKFTTEAFAAGIIIVPFILLGYAFYLITVFVEIIIYLKEASHKLLFIYLISAFCNIVLNIIFIPRFGMLGAAITTAITFFLQFLITCFVVRRYLVLKFDVLFFLKILFAAAVMAITIIRIPQNSFFNISFIIFCGIAIYLSVAFLLKVFRKSQLESIRILLS